MDAAPVSTEDLVHHGIAASAEAEGGSPRVWIPGRRLLTVGMVTLITIAASEALAVATIMPLVEDDLGDLALYGWVFSAFMLGNVLGIVFAGWLADRMRLAWVLTGGLVLFVTGLALGSVASSMVLLVAARAVQGIGAGSIPAVGTVTVARAYAPAARPRMFALFSTAWIVPALVGPALASRVGVAFGWRWVFGGLIPLALLAGLITIVALRTIPSRDARADVSRGRVSRTLVLVAGAAAMLTGLQFEPRVAGVVLFVAGGGAAGWSLRHLLPAGTFVLRRGLPATVGCKGLFTFAFFGAEAFVPLSLTDVRGVTEDYAGLVITAASLSWAAMAWVQERFVRRIGPRPLVRLGFSLLASGVLAIFVVIAVQPPVILAFPAWMLAGAGAGLLFAPLSAAGLAAAEPGAESTASSGLLLSETLGIALGTGVAGAIVATATGAALSLEVGVTSVFAVSALAALAGAVAAGRIPSSVLAGDEPRR